MKRKTKIVRYAVGVDSEKSDHEIKIPKWKSRKITSVYIKTYEEALPFLIELSGTERAVLDFALFQMDKDNFVSNDSFFKEGLNTLHQKKFPTNTINKSFSRLCSANIFLKHKSFGRGLYQVNPTFFFKGSEQSRIKWIRKILEFPFYKENTEMRKDYYSGM